MNVKLEGGNVRREFAYPGTAGATSLTAVVFAILALAHVDLDPTEQGAVATLCAASGVVFARVAAWYRSRR